VGGVPQGAGQRPGGRRLIVRVVDRGPGIAAGQLERVFEPFHRSGQPAGRDGGAGLGLAIARGFTQANAGWLYAESLPGQGATFVFELPLADGSPEGTHGDGPPDEARAPATAAPAAGAAPATVAAPATAAAPAPTVAYGR
jgi:two-component system sensor histidine kinase KdpD